MTWCELGRVRTLEGDELVARVGDDACEIRMNGYELMSSRGHASEDALGRLGCADVPAGGCVLIGGLGLGYTLRAALDALAGDARVLVAELLPALVGWVRGPLAHLAGDALADPRVAMHEGDVSALLRASPECFDAIILDIDNGPDGRVRAGNAWLGEGEGIGVIRAALRRGGVFTSWSADPVPAFERLLRGAGFATEAIEVSATVQGGPMHTIYRARLT
jgi:spermidine synthase